MRLRHTDTTDADSPDADRAGLTVPATLPALLLEFLTLLIRQMLRQWLPARARLMPSWWVTLPDCAPGSTQELAASIRGPFGHAMAHMCRYWGYGPGHQDWPYLRRSILAFGGSLKGVDGRKHPQPWHDTPEIIPGMIRADATTTPTAAALLAQRLAADLPPPPPQPVLAAGAGPAVSPAPLRPVLARAATGPPTGPPRAGPSLPSRLINGAGAWPAPPNRFVLITPVLARGVATAVGRKSAAPAAIAPTGVQRPLPLPRETGLLCTTAEGATLFRPTGLPRRQRSITRQHPMPSGAMPTATGQRPSHQKRTETAVRLVPPSRVRQHPMPSGAMPMAAGRRSSHQK